MLLIITLILTAIQVSAVSFIQINDMIIPISKIFNARQLTKEMRY